MNEKIKSYYVADDIDEVLNYIDNLEQENARLKDRINKAIEYVETNTCWDLRTSEVLEILKGEQNEQN